MFKAVPGKTGHWTVVVRRVGMNQDKVQILEVPRDVLCPDGKTCRELCEEIADELAAARAANTQAVL
eukprot:8601141-Lingulodinium_polyedra.AAC.1